MGERVHITKAGGAGYKIIELFNGGAESYFHDNKIKKWDICAGEAILRSTCYGKFTDMNGDKIDYRYNGKIRSGLSRTTFDRFFAPT